MHEELRRSNSIGNTEGINTFLSLVFEQKLAGVDALNHACRFLLFYQLNCRLALMFLEDLGLISVVSGVITVLPDGEGLLGGSVGEVKKALAKITVNKMIKENLLNPQKVSVDNVTGDLRISANAIQLDATIYVTFLQSIDCFRRSGAYFVFNDDLLRQDFEQKIIQKKRKITQEELLLKLQKQQEDGDVGEQFVIEYETRRLEKLDLLPKRVSAIDVSAGYDIMSCNDRLSTTYDRYIEVKAFRGSPHFYWSENERSVAMLLADAYFIYLVDLGQIEDTDYTPLIIQNPANNLDALGWLIKPQSYLVQHF